MKTMRKILVLGASGYIGQHLVARLSAAGHQVTAAARRVAWLEKQPWPGVTCRYVDLHQPESIPPLLEDVDTLYYLIHSMGDGARLVEREQQAAANLRSTLLRYPVKQIIYLSSLQTREGDSHSAHLQARQLTGDILRDADIPVTELRAGIIVGAGSAAFEVMRDMVYNLPVLTPPRWVRSRTSPIALENLLVYLERLPESAGEQHRIFEAAGPEILSYQQQFEHFMAISGCHRPLIPVPLPTRLISVWFLTMITSVPAPVARALIQGLKHDLIPDDTALRALIPQKLITFDDALRQTLESERHLSHSADWGYDALAHARWRPEYGYYPKQAGYTLTTRASAAALWQVVNQLGSPQRGYFFANILWQIRALMDRLVGHRLPVGRPTHPYLHPGDQVDSWKVIVAEPLRELTLLFGMKAPGLGRLSFTLEDNGEVRTLDVRAWWHPHGTPGLLYWLVMIPAHLFIFKGMARRIVRLAEQSSHKSP
ncbi:DUF2867 domain-containing protein [Shimwellia blattae]|nr:DUF2867 domain-containing protein [Shimwellia blattae]GAB79795.1 hypothetical protein YbjT [Shimwellia blattae DSM 4481 = NBRC 105725]VDY65127.1 short chain dehydrogenase [Shimwellia blattae]VEC23651.1 short chain dehydrogenase [Shimwellia blattae]